MATAKAKTNDNILAKAIEEVPLSRLKPYRKNPRRGNIEAIAGSLEANGQYRPLVVQKSTNEILAGNHTYYAAKHLQWKSIGIVYVEVDDERAKAIVLADNKTADLGTYDDTVLAELLASISEEDLPSTGFVAEEVDQLLANIQAGESTDFDALAQIEEGTIEGVDHMASRLAGSGGLAASSNEDLEDAELEDPFEPDEAEIEALESNDPESLDDIEGEDAGTLVQLKDDVVFDSPLKWHIPQLLLAGCCTADSVAPDLKCWAGKDATPDDGVSHYLYNYGVDSASGLPWDRAILSFYTHDRFFESWWEYPAYYVSKLLKSGIVSAISPNFSLWEAPDAVNLFNVYRARWIGRYLMEVGVPLIPDVQWKDENTMDWSLLGLPKNAPWLSIQLQNFTQTEDQMAKELKHVMEKLEPENLLIYGGPPAERVRDAAKLSCNTQFVLNRAAIRRGMIFDEKKRNPDISTKGVHGDSGGPDDDDE